MLTGITLENFKAFKEPQFIPIKPITLVFGPNSVGKSSIVHALAFLKHVHLTKGHCDPEEVDFGWSKVYLGSWQNLVHGHDASSTMRVTLHSTRGSICWEFGNGTHGPRVLSFNICEGNIPIARGTNTNNKHILWEIEIHHSHPIIKSYKKTLWKLLIGNSSDKPIISEDLLNQYSNHFDHWNKKQWRFLPESFCHESKLNLFPVALLLDSDMKDSMLYLDDIPF